MKHTVAIIGTGMIGCSFALSLRQKSPDQFSHILGYSSGDSAEKAKKLGYIDDIVSVETIFTHATIIMISAPLLATEQIIQNSPIPQPHQLVIDVGSVKYAVLQTVKKAWQENARYFVPCHPIAGLEKTGPESATGELYDNKRVILTPDQSTCPEKVQQAEKLWQLCQAEVHYMDAQKHDQLLSKSSHLPHLLAFALVAGQYQRDGESCFEWSAGGLKDFTRIAGSDPTMWRDVCISNHDKIHHALEDYIQDLKQLQRLIQTRDEIALKVLFERSKNARDTFYSGQ